MNYYYHPILGLQYLDEVEEISEEAIEIIRFLEISNVRKENVK